MNPVRSTPFHARSAECNPRNAWVERNGFTLAANYGDAAGEALAARMSVVMTDISWRWRVRFEGAHAGAALSRLMTRSPEGLAPGIAVKALWLNDAGAVRGAGVIARMSENAFLLASAAPDRDWILAAARLFDVSISDVTEREVGLGLIGPYAGRLLAAAGLDPVLEPLASRASSWRGLDIVLSRWGEHGGFEIWCGSDDAALVWDRIARAGTPFGLRVAGCAATDTLDLEGGIPRPGRDYVPARSGDAAEPRSHALGLDRLIDPDHAEFNGRAAWLARRQSPGRTLAGLAIDGEIPAPNTPVRRDGRIVGQTLGSLYSPALRRAIALVQVEAAAASPGTALSLLLPPAIDRPPVHARAEVSALPFLPFPDSLPA